MSSDDRDDANDQSRGGQSGRTTRRRFLETTAAGAIGLVVGCGGGVDGADGGAGLDGARADDAGGPDGAPPDAGPADAGVVRPVVPPDDTPEVASFGIGVSSGDVTPRAAIVAARYDGLAPLAVAAWEMDGERYVRQFGEFEVAPADGGFVHYELTGLSAGRHYRYAFFEMEGTTRVGRSAIGAFRAAIAPDSTERLTVGAVSCTSNTRAKTTLERAGERSDIALFLLLGDTTYNDGASTLAQYRAKWAESLSSPGWLATRRSTSVLATWDDHEVDNDYNPEGADLSNPTRTFFEHLPLRRDAAAPDRLWKSMRWGRTVEFFVLDCRSERLPSTRGTTDQYISRAQMDWLKGALMASPCVFKLIANSVPISDFPTAFDLPSFQRDRWEGYPRQREEILRFIDDNAINGVLWISGDFHFASIGKVARSGVGANQTEVLAGPGAQSGNVAGLSLPREQFPWSSTTNNYTSFELIPSERRIRVYWHDGGGSVIHTAEVDYPA
jgi:alkaline phosphatase D